VRQLRGGKLHTQHAQKLPFAQCMQLLDAGFWIMLMNVENNYYLFITLLFISTAFVYHL